MLAARDAELQRSGRTGSNVCSLAPLTALQNAVSAVARRVSQRRNPRVGSDERVLLQALVWKQSKYRAVPRQRLCCVTDAGVYFFADPCEPLAPRGPRGRGPTEMVPWSCIHAVHLQARNSARGGCCVQFRLGGSRRLTLEQDGSSAEPAADLWYTTLHGIAAVYGTQLRCELWADRGADREGEQVRDRIAVVDATVDRLLDVLLRDHP